MCFPKVPLALHEESFVLLAQWFLEGGQHAPGPGEKCPELEALGQGLAICVLSRLPGDAGEAPS